MVSIVIVKLFGVAWITLMSAVGIWAPFLCVGGTGYGLVSRSAGSSNGGAGRLVNVRPTHVPSGRIFLSLANCFSAGMLLTMALAHFFPSALAVADDTLTPSMLSCWMLVGVLVPALLEHGAGGSGGGHAHSHGHSHGIAPSSASDEAHNESKAKAESTLSTATLLVILMCFHGMMEGLLLGLEQHASSLISAAVPLSIHRFFDGLVIGVSFAKEVLRSLRSDLSDPESLALTEEPSSVDSEAPSHRLNLVSRNTGSAPRAANETGARKQAFSLCGRRVWQPSIILWLALTPTTMLAVLLLSSFSMAPAGAVAEEEAGPRLSLSNTSTVKDSGARMRWMGIAQAVGAGSFVYVGLSVFLQEELKGMKADFSLLLGVVFTLLLFALSGDDH